MSGYKEKDVVSDRSQKQKRGRNGGKRIEKNKIVGLLLAGGIAVTPLQSVAAQVIRDGNSFMFTGDAEEDNEQNKL